MNKKLAGIFAMCALLLTGCQGAKESSKEITPPDTGWGKTVDEVLADWNLDRDQVEIFSETNSAAAIAVDTEATVFGEQTSRVMFQFINLDQIGATGKPVLCEVDITYPDDADMDTVKKEMEKSYGSSKDSITRYELYQSLGDDQLPEYTYKKADQLAVWSGESLKDAIPSDKSTEYETAWEAYQPGLTADNWESYTEQTSMATAVCAYGAEAFPMFEKNGVSLEAYPGLVYEGYKGNSSKLEMCMELVQNAVNGGHKILLFSQFTTMLDVLAVRLKKAKVSFYMLTGSTSKEKRAQMVQAFNEDDTSVFCISLKAGGTGLNLTAADIVIHYDPWWNLAVQNQATDRAHRIGQQNVVSVYRLFMKDTIEERIRALQERKRELADEILSGEGIGQALISREEVLKLLGR